MKKLLLIASLSLSMLSQAQEYSRAKVLTDSRGLQTLAELGIAVDHGTVKRETFFISDFSTDEIQLIRNAGYEVEILIPDVKQYYVNRNATQTEPSRNASCSGQQGNNGFIPEVPTNFNLGTMGGFYKYQEFIDEIDAMAVQYPNLITVKDTINNYLSIENRPIYFMRMSDNAATDESEPEILYTSIHHAREPNSLSEVIFYMWYLLENYDNSEEIQFLLDNTELYFVPMVNPDGYIYNETTDPNGGGMWRKNRRNNGGSYGVDLNRNYSYLWGTSGISMTPSADTYPGTGAFSEPETQAIQWFCEDRDFVFAFNAHTYADDILHPIGTTVAEFADDHDYFQAFTGHMVLYNGYGHIKSSDLYPASGDSDDYMYKVDTVQKPKIFAMTPEVGSDGDGFWPASADITGICQEMVFSNLILAHLAHKYIVVTDTDPSTVENMTGNFNHTAYRLGQEDGAVTVSIEALEGIQSVGSGVSHDLTIMELANGAISYTLDPAIQYGDVIRYALNTEYALWTKRDTIVKTFGSITSQFIDDASTIVNWTGNWTTTSTEYVSPTKSFTESPSGDYNNNTTRTYTFNEVVDLSHVTEAAVNYYAKWEIESDYDFCQFEVSIDGGTTWIGQCGLYTNIATSADGVQPVGEPVYDGEQSSWVLEEISLSDYIGETDVRMRFVLKSDGGVRMDGFYFDDFELMYNIDYTNVEETILSAKSMPNPANTYAQIAFDQPVSNGLISVYNMTGELIHSEKVTDLTNKIVLNTANWSEGMYTVIVSETAQFISPAKLVVVH
ncbi:MAG: M14 family zinc carboxypeptidase [Bacteroidota bacterium]